MDIPSRIRAVRGHSPRSRARRERSPELLARLMKQLRKMAAVGLTDVGRRRPHNEDSIIVIEELGLFAVADGMGGHAAGEVASRSAVQTLHDFIRQASIDRDFTWPLGLDQQFSLAENMLLTGFQLANRRVGRLASDNVQYTGMGTTLAALYAPDSQVHIAHVGDSRIYRYHGEQLELLTADHSWVNEQLQRRIITEDEARNHRWRNVITRALGNRQELEVDLKTLPTRAGDLYLICSDGLTGMVSDEQIARVLGEESDELGEACRRLVDLANEAGGMDNVSVVLVRVEESAAPIPGSARPV